MGLLNRVYQPGVFNTCVRALIDESAPAGYHIPRTRVC